MTVEKLNEFKNDLTKKRENFDRKLLIFFDLKIFFFLIEN